MKHGIAKSNLKESNKIVYEDFFDKSKVLPIFPALDVYAEEISKLKTIGKSLDDFDLLIGSTAIYYDLTLITRNESDFDRIKGIRIEDWTKKTNVKSRFAKTGNRCNYDKFVILAL